jgi:hypothetical protein
VSAPSRIPPLARLLLVTAALHLALKLAVVGWAGPDSYIGLVFEPDGRPAGEEILRGSATRDFLEGPLLPWWAYQLNAFSGGSLVYSIVAVPFQAALGHHLFALRLASYVFSGGAAAR